MDGKEATGAARAPGATRTTCTSRRDILAGVTATAAVTAFPIIPRAQGKRPIRIGMPTVLSGPYTVIGETCRAATLLAIDKFNAAGGLDGRMLELVVRDDKTKPDEGARVAREMINNDRVDLFVSAATSASTFAIQEVMRETGHLCIHTVSETSTLTADPKLRAPNTFRCARQGVHDAIAAARYGADLARSRPMKRWMTTCQDFAYGRALQAQFVGFLRQFEPGVEIIGAAWPKLAAPDYTETVTQILGAKPDALYITLAGGEIVSFLDQARLYNVFDRVQIFAQNMADISALKQIKKLPPNTYSGSRYVPGYPANPANAAWNQAMEGKYKATGSNWSWQTAVALDFLIAAMRQTGSADGKVLAGALRGMTIESPFGTDGQITMRAEDQTIVDYAIGWGLAVTEPPYFKDVTPADWGAIIQYEKEWKKAQGFA